MVLQKIKEFDPDYRDHFDNDDVIGLDLYSSSEKVGTVDDVLVDEEGQFRYLIINTGVWILGKKVLLPIGRARIDYNARRVYADITKAQVEALPEYNNDMTPDYDYEERVRGVYRPAIGAEEAAAGVGYAGLGSAPTTANVAPSIDPEAGYAGYDRPVDRPVLQDSTSAPAASGVGYSGAGSAPMTDNAAAPLDLAPGYTGYDRDTYTYQQEPALYDINEQNHQSLKLYQERLIANKTRQKTGEVTIGKHVETEATRVSVPIEKERVVIERLPAEGSSETVAPGEAFREGEVARMEIYEEVPDIHKETFVREEVKVSKVVDREVVNADETVRREELDIDTDGNPIVR